MLGVEFKRFDMSNYQERHGEPPLALRPATWATNKAESSRMPSTATPLRPPLDEIEKAHEDIYNLLLQVMDHATLTDNLARKPTSATSSSS